MIVAGRIRVVFVTAALVAVALTCALIATSDASSTRTRTVKARDSFYSPRKLTVRSGTKVVWDFQGDLPHNVEVRRGPELFSSAITKSGTFAHRMRKRGTYRLVCSLHTDMTMKVIVK